MCRCKVSVVNEAAPRDRDRDLWAKRYRTMPSLIEQHQTVSSTWVMYSPVWVLSFVMGLLWCPAGAQPSLRSMKALHEHDVVEDSAVAFDRTTGLIWTIEASGMPSRDFDRVTFVAYDEHFKQVEKVTHRSKGLYAPELLTADSGVVYALQARETMGRLEVIRSSFSSAGAGIQTTGPELKAGHASSPKVIGQPRIFANADGSAALVLALTGTRKQTTGFIYLIIDRHMRTVAEGALALPEPLGRDPDVFVSFTATGGSLLTLHSVTTGFVCQLAQESRVVRIEDEGRWFLSLAACPMVDGRVLVAGVTKNAGGVDGSIISTTVDHSGGVAPIARKALDEETLLFLKLHRHAVVQLLKHGLEEPDLADKRAASARRTESMLVSWFGEGAEGSYLLVNEICYYKDGSNGLGYWLKEHILAISFDAQGQVVTANVLSRLMGHGRKPSVLVVPSSEGPYLLYNGPIGLAEMNDARSRGMKRAPVGCPQQQEASFAALIDAKGVVTTTPLSESTSNCEPSQYVKTALCLQRDGLPPVLGLVRKGVPHFALFEVQ